MSVENKYDVAIIGVWYGLNYGSLLTYYALRKQIMDAGKSVAMVKYLPDRRPESMNEEQDLTAHNNRFIEKHEYETFTVYSHDSRSINGLADTFVLGSDQVWNYHIAKAYDDFFYFSEIDESKRKIANAVSLGHSVDFAPAAERPRIANLMKRLNAISVREDNAVGLLRDAYDVSSVWHADPLLTIDSDDIRKLAGDVVVDTGERDYLLAYILDPSADKIAGIEKLAEKLNLDVRVVVDGFAHNRESNIQRLGTLGDRVQDGVGVEEFVALFANCAYVVTDSFHGTVMSIKMEKDFAVVTAPNMHRGMARLNSLLRLTGLFARHTFDGMALPGKQRFSTSIDYERINKVVSRTARLSILWLTSALDIPVDMKVDSSPLILSDEDLFNLMVEKRSWNFGLIGEKPYVQNAKFNGDGLIEGIRSDNEFSWEVTDSKVLIRNKAGDLSHTFIVESLSFGKPVLRGDTAFDHSLIHILS